MPLKVFFSFNSNVEGFSLTYGNAEKWRLTWLHLLISNQLRNTLFSFSNFTHFTLDCLILYGPLLMNLIKG